MRKLAMLVALSAAACIPTSAGAGETYETSLNVLAETPTGDGEILWSGRVESDKAKCEPGRTVRAFFDAGAGFEQVDETVSSRRGAFAVLFPSDPGTYKLKVPGKQLKSGLCFGVNVQISP